MTDKNRPSRTIFSSSIFVSSHPAHRPPGARGEVYSDIVPSSCAERRSAHDEAEGINHVGRAGLLSDAGAPSCRPRFYLRCVPILASATASRLAQQLGGTVRRPATTAFGRAEVSDGARPVRRVMRKGVISGLDDHGDRVPPSAGGVSGGRWSPNAPVPMIADEARTFYSTGHHSSTSRSFTRRTRGAHPQFFRCARSSLAVATGPAGVPRLCDRSIRKQVGKGGDRRSLGLRRQSRVAAVLIPRGDRRPAHLRFRRPWACCG